MSKKPSSKKPVAKKPVAKVVSKKPVAAKAPVAKKPVAKNPATAKSIKVPAKKPTPVGKGQPVKGSSGKAVAIVKGKKVEAKVPVRDLKAEHEKQKQLLDNHRKGHHQSSEIEAPPPPKRQHYTIEDVLAYLKNRKKEGAKLNLWVPDEERKAREKAAVASREKGVKTHSIAAASIADLLGGNNPFRKGGAVQDELHQIPEKLRRYYHLLLSMREAIQKGLAFHAEEALKKNGKDDAGDLSGYSQHLADAGSDTADRDFALSLISNEQEALKEIADAIARMKKGTYGVCEITNKPIPHARLMAVPFTRYSLEGQKELERNRRAHRRRGGNPLGEIGDEVGFGSGGGGGEDDSPES
jgi:RNA polymerase-binding transcription factor DksA